MMGKREVVEPNTTLELFTSIGDKIDRSPDDNDVAPAQAEKTPQKQCSSTQLK